MSNENAPAEEPINHFFYVLTFKTRGLVRTHLSDIEELRSAMIVDFSEAHGAENFSIDDLRLATAEEIDAIEKQSAQLEALLSGDTPEEPAPTTIN